MLTKVILLFLFCKAIVDGGEFIPPKDMKNAIKDTYIVLLKPNSTSSSLNQIIADYKDEQKEISKYEFGDFIGYSAKFEESIRSKIVKDSRVAYVEQDEIYNLNEYYNCSESQQTSEYNLMRISQTSNPEPNFYRYVSQAGAGVNVYILDTGIYVGHNEFSGRAVRGRSFIWRESVDDVRGHGTCIASIVAGTQFGAAKLATVIGVKVANNSGHAFKTSIIAGLAYTFLDRRDGKKLVLLALNGPTSSIVNHAIRSLTKLASIPVFVSAGNYRQDSAFNSPASEDSAIVIAASDENNSLTQFSNYGSMVDIIAPGSNIKCAGITAPNDFIYKSGTSHAAALAAGVGAVVLSSTPIRLIEQLVVHLIDISKKGVISGLTGIKARTPNRLLYNGCK